MKKSSFFLTRVASASNKLSPSLKKQDTFNRTYEDGKCHVTTINACTDEHAVLKLTPMKGFVSVKTPKIFPLPKEAIEGLKNALIESKKPAKVVQHEADQLTEKLNQRRFPASPKEVQAARREIVAQLKSDEMSDFNLGPEHFSQKVLNAQEKYLYRQVSKKLKKTRYNWMPLEFKDKEDAAIFTLSRIAPYYAEVRKVLNEFERINFKPKTVLDYGSGCGSAFWASRGAWGDEFDEYCLVDVDNNISHFAMDVMRGENNPEEVGLVSKNVYFRRTLVPSPQKKYDLVILHRTLIEIASHEQRLELISTLWNRTNRFLVIIESELEDSFEAVIQARNFILTNGVKMNSSLLKEILIREGIFNDDVEAIIKNKMMSYSEKFLLLREKLPNPEKLPTFIETGHVFAPCPHDGGCPLVDMAPGRKSCKFVAKWQEFRADGKTKSKNKDGTGSSMFSYCIMEKGLRPQKSTPGRLLDKSKASGCVTCKVCTEFDGIQRFPVSKRAGPLYQLAKSAVPGQLFPLEGEIVASEGDYHILVTQPDCSPSSLQPLVQLQLHCEGSDRNPSEPLVFEFTPKERTSIMAMRLYPNLPAGYMWKSAVKVILGGGIVYVGAELYCGSESFYRTILPVTRKYFDGEQSHEIAVKMAKYGLLPRMGDNVKEYETLKTNVFGKDFVNPIGLAAGFDKDGEAVENLRKSGLGFVEIGSVTPRPQLGNPKPRVFRLVEDEGVINRYGFNSKGCGPVSAKIKQIYEPNNPIFLGINLGKNKTTVDAASDYEIGVGSFAPWCDYLVVNVSSPNTPGLRSLQGKKELGKLLKTVKSAVDREESEFGRRPTVLLKIAPDLNFRDKRDISKVIEKEESGGLSGKPLRELSTKVVGEMYQLTDGKIPIIGCGGISSGQDAYEKIRAGASLVQLYTAMVFQGFPVIGKVKRELDECLRKDGFGNVQEAVGVDFPGIKNNK
ncbi:hypothetical protein FO519_008213 [Halicephalobus sp. NKZ332]|nr:hypothetical protein FO519_008213 [Halicephalobus sp. NKZ332]